MALYDAILPPVAAPPPIAAQNRRFYATARYILRSRRQLPDPIADAGSNYLIARKRTKRHSVHPEPTTQNGQMSALYFISHPEVTVDPRTPVERWHLSAAGVERMRAFSQSSTLSNVSAIWSSTEAKAIEAAGILGGALGLGIRVSKDLGENDRGATGFLPPDEFENVADAFFSSPDKGIRGWERAVEAQGRVRKAVAQIASEHTDGDLAIVAHGAIGTLLFCALTGNAIARSFDQPFQGHYWTATLADLVPVHGWTSIAPRV